MKVAICTPTITRPFPAYLDALEASVPLLEAAGMDVSSVYEVGCPYISGARATLLRKAMGWGADVFVFLDHDMSWRPADLLSLIQADGDVVSGLYRFKLPNESYMGTIFTEDDGRPVVRADGCIKAERVPAGFLKVTRAAVERFMAAYPQLTIRDGAGVESPDLFNHGAYDGKWWGEDYAFSRNWLRCGGEIWVVPDMDLTHHDVTGEHFGNFHSFMMRQPGGANDPAKGAATAA